jgi:hypothetical protein
MLNLYPRVAASAGVEAVGLAIAHFIHSAQQMTYSAMMQA